MQSRMKKNTEPTHKNYVNIKTVRFRQLSKRYSLPILTTTQEQSRYAKLLQQSSRSEHQQQEPKKLGQTTNSDSNSLLTKKVLSRQNSWPLSSTPAFAPVFQLNKSVLRKYTHAYSNENYVYKKRYFTTQDTMDFKPQLKLPRVAEGGRERSDRSCCDSVSGSMQCSSLTSKHSSIRQPRRLNDGYRVNGPFKNKPEHVVQWLKTSLKKRDK